MAGRGSYGALPDAEFADEHDLELDPVLPPISTGARRRNVLPENGGAHVDGYHFTAAAHATDGLGVQQSVQAPASGAFGAALQGHRDGSRPANVAETLQGMAPPLITAYVTWTRSFRLWQAPGLSRPYSFCRAVADKPM